MNTNEFVEKYTKIMWSYKELRNEHESICRKSKKSTSEYKRSYKKADDLSLVVSILEKMLDDYRKTLNNQ